MLQESKDGYTWKESSQIEFLRIFESYIWDGDTILYYLKTNPSQTIYFLDTNYRWNDE